jgi:nitroreductase
MTHNPTIETLMKRKSIRACQGKEVGDDLIEAIVRVTICVDSHRLGVVMAPRYREMIQNDLSLLLFGIQDASLMAQNMDIAAESLGLGSCFLGGAPYRAEAIIKEYKLPERVFPLVQLAMGHPAEDPPTRPRYPTDYTLF